MQASPAKVIEYFNGEKQNLIPLFQRPYTWKETNWQTLWDDVMVQYDLDDTSTHFMGAIVSVPARSVPVGVSKYLIIDGQQRLTTVSILLCALRDCLDDNTANRIQEVYLMNRFREQEDTPKFVPTQADRVAYTSIAINRIIPDHDGLLVQAYHYFKKKLQSGKDSNDEAISPTKVLTTLEHALQVVMINLSDSDDPYLIFESLNFKGEPLNQADLVRNYVLMRFRHSIAAGGEQERVYLHYWKPMEDLLGGNHSEFLRHYSMKDGDDIRQGGIYAAIKNHLKNMDSSDKVEAEIKRMQTYATFYAKFIDPSQEANVPLQKRLEHIKSLNVTTSYPLLLRLFGARQDEILSDTDLEVCLGLVESFFIRRAVCVVPTNQLNKMFLQWAKNFPEMDHVVWLHAAMAAGGGGRRWPADTEFEEALKNQPQYGRGSTRFILCQLEESFEHKEPVDLSTATIEHVLPQTMTPEWEAELGAEHQSVYTHFIDTIGNLTLTGYNPELGNIPFAEKKQKLQNTHIELNRWILEQEHWSESEIKMRSQNMAALAKTIWTGPRTHNEKS